MPSRSETLFTWSERTLIALGVIFYLFVFPHGTHGDAYVRYLAVEALATRGEWIAHKYPMLGPLCSLPLYWLGLVVKHPHWWVSRFNAICFLLFLAALHRLLRAEITNAGARRRLILLLLVGTMFSKHVTDFYGEVFTTCLAAISFTCLLLRARPLGFLGISLSIASAPPTVIAHALASTRLAWIRRRWRYVLPIFFGVLLVVAENLFRFGTLVSEQYFRDSTSTTIALPYARMNGFHYPFLFGFLSICFSFGKGIVFFCCGLLAIPFAQKYLPENLRELQRVWICYVLGLLLIYAKWSAWHGDWYWGPRYFLFAGLPAALAVHALVERGRSGLGETCATLAALTLTVWVGLTGVAFGQNNLELCGENGGYLIGFCWYVPEFSALWRPFIAEKGLGGKQLAFAVYFGLAYLYLALPLWNYLLRELAFRARDLFNNRQRIFREWRF